MKLLILVTLFTGEALVIWAEMLGASLYAAGNLSLVRVLMYTALPLCAGSVFLVLSYTFGLRMFSNIWILSVTSLGAVLTVEPLFNFFYIGQTPTPGAGIGFVLGVMGIIASYTL